MSPGHVLHGFFHAAFSLECGVYDSQSGFVPSLKILSRIVKVLLKKGFVGKTSLSQEANIHYGRLLMHLKWLEKKYLPKISDVVSS